MPNVKQTFVYVYIII